MKIRILIIDDDEDLLYIAERFLPEKDSDIELISVIDAQQAVQILDEDHVDAVICDFYMGPDQMNGIELLAWLRDSGNNIPFIIFTGQSREEVAIKALNLGADYYLQKSDDLEQLFEEMRYHIKSVVKSRRIEEALELTERDYRTIANSSSDMIFVLDENDFFSRYHTKEDELLFNPPEEFMGKHIADILPENVSKPYLELAETVRTYGTLQHFEFHLVLDKKKKWFSANLNLHEDEKSIVVTVSDITERKQAEEALKESEERYRTIISSMQDIIFVHDKDDYFTGVYAADEKYLLRPASEFIGTHPTDLDDPKLYELFRNYASKVRDTGHSVTYDYSLIIEGKEEWFTAVLSLHEDGESIVAVARPITERKRTERLLKESQEMLETVVNSIPQFVFWKDTEGKYLGYNKRYAEFLRIRSHESIVGKDDSQLGWSQENLEEIEEIDNWVIKNNAPILNKVVEKVKEDGRVSHYELNIIPLQAEDKSTIGILGVNVDITDQVQMNLALKNSEEKYRSLVNNVPSGIAIFGGTPLRILFANPAFEEILGYSFEEMLLKSQDELKSVIHPEDRFDVLDNLLGEKERRDYEDSFVIRAIHKNGHVIWLRIIPTLMKYEGESASLVTFLDITARITSAQELAKSESRYRALFEDSPICILEEDWSRVKDRVDMLHNKGVKNLKEFLMQNENELRTCTELIEITGANRGAIELHGMTSEEELLGPLSIILGEDAYRVFIDEIVAMSDGSLYYESKPEYLSVSGEKRYLLLRLTVPPGHETTLDRVVVTMVDITEDKRNEEKLRKLSKAIEQSSSTVIITDTEGIIEYVNPKFTELTGYDPEEVIGKNPRILKSDFTKPETHQELWTTIISGKEWQGTLANRRKDGEIYWESANIAPVFNSDGEITHYIAVKQDITAQRQSEIMLQTERDRAQLLLDTVDTIIVTVDRNLNITQVNRKCLNLLSYDDEEIIGKNIINTIIPEERKEKIQDYMQRLVRGVEIPRKNDECLVVSKAGESRHIIWSDEFIKDS
ncbi:MAG: PAS domain S-box protein, partial [Candidatus Thorarchaeota archaeon]